MSRCMSRPSRSIPESPALPISHPAYYSAYLAKLLGSFATVGMAEDTWALNEGAIDESEFLTQAYSIMDEREAMFDNALAHTKRGVVACVFDTSDRVQHMFFRHLDGHGDARWAGVIENLYERMDRLVGKAMENVDDADCAVRAFRPWFLRISPRGESEFLAASATAIWF